MNNQLLESIGVHILNMDTAVEEQVVKNEDGSYSIFINARCSQERQMRAYRHAIAHIMDGDFDKEQADDIEKAM